MRGPATVADPVRSSGSSGSPAQPRRPATRDSGTVVRCGVRNGHSTFCTFPRTGRAAPWHPETRTASAWKAKHPFAEKDFAMRKFIRPICAAAWVAGLGSPAAADEVTVTVSYADLDLASPEDVAALHERLAEALRQ